MFGMRAYWPALLRYHYPGLCLNEGIHKGRDPFELMPMCPREHSRDILLKVSSLRVLLCHNPRPARVHTRGYWPPNDCVLTSGLRGGLVVYSLSNGGEFL